MINRIKENEEYLDKLLESTKELQKAIDSFKSNIDNLNKLNNYYGSKNWFKDKEAYEKNLIPKVKCGVLSEDAVWNLNDDIKELTNEMKDIIKRVGGNMEEEKCKCGPDCTCGCQEGKECTCEDENCSCGCGDNCECDDTCTCGCHDKENK